MSGQTGGIGKNDKIVDMEVEDSAQVARIELGLSPAEIAATEAQMQLGAPNAKRTARAKSVDMGGLSLLGDLEAKLAAATAPKAGAIDLKAAQAAIEKDGKFTLFPFADSHPERFSITDMSQPDNTLPVMTLKDGRMSICDFDDQSGPDEPTVKCSVAVKPGDDLAKAFKTLMKRYDSEDFDGKAAVPTKPPGTGGIKPPKPDPKPSTASDKDIRMGLDAVREERGDVVAMSLGKVLKGFQVEPGDKPLTWKVQSDEVTNYEVKIHGGKLELKNMQTGKTATGACPPWTGFKAGELDRFLTGLEAAAKQLDQQTKKK